MLTDIPCSTSSGENDFRGKSFSPPSPAQETQRCTTRYLLCRRNAFPCSGDAGVPSESQLAHAIPDAPAAGGGKALRRVEAFPYEGRWFFTFPRKAMNRMRWKIGDPPGKRRICQISCPLVCRRHNRVPAGGKAPVLDSACFFRSDIV